MEWIEPVVGHNQDVAIGNSVSVGADGINHALHRLVCHLIGNGNVIAVARELRWILILADRVWVGGIRRLPWIDREELMLGAVRLLDVNHQQIDVWESRNCAQTNIGLIRNKLPHQLFVDRLKLGIWETSES